MAKIDRQGKTLIIHCMVQRLTTKESLQFLAAHDIHISKQTLMEWKRRIKENRFRRMNEIADTGHVDYHLDAIDTIEWAKKEMVAQYYKEREKDPVKATDILVAIVNLGPIMTGYISESKEVMKNKAILESTERKESIASEISP